MVRALAFQYESSILGSRLKTHSETKKENLNMTNEIMEIRPVSRELTKFVVGLAGQSGDGKTRSALELAHGLTNYDPSKIGFLDTENRRGSLYSDIFGANKFLIGDLTPPFSPDRYAAAMRQFADQNIEVLIIDSITHEWEGEGGCEEIAHAPKADGSQRKVANWLEAKRQHKRFMNTLLFLPVHIIACIRSREKTDFRDPTKPVSLGIQPITEKNVMFECTFSFQLSQRGQRRQILKLGGDMERIVGTDGYITAEHGKALRDWIGGFDPMEKAKASLRLAASQGTDILKVCWLALPTKSQKALASFKDTLKPLADAADKEALQNIGPDSKDEWENEK